MNVVSQKSTLTARDYASDQEVRWCPGCGDYAILKTVQKMLADVQAAPEKTVFVSGIGCSSRFPYYLSTFGFHTIHGRAPAIATGIKIANPDLDVWIVTGDGDGLSIGGNHLLHTLRRDPDVQILLFNNEIYGLTKGQYSPTSRAGTRSPSSPSGSHDRPLSAASFALGAGARFVARSVDTQNNHLGEVLKRAHAHRGASFVEIYQNCIVYNADVFQSFTDRANTVDRQILVEHGQPLLFGRDRRYGLRLNAETLTLDIVTLGENGISEKHILVHDQTNRTLATMLAAFEPPHTPVALGVLYADPSPTGIKVNSADTALTDDRAIGMMLNDLVRKGETWVVTADDASGGG
jgi:2-oxoglutarate ferredoxin oxidoreductase subunit beta